MRCKHLNIYPMRLLSIGLGRRRAAVYVEIGRRTHGDSGSEGSLCVKINRCTLYCCFLIDSK